jgi:hypothetical protein
MNAIVAAVIFEGKLQKKSPLILVYQGSTIRELLFIKS